MKIETGHVAVITGAGGGIGSAIARGLAEKGCALALVDVSAGALNKAVSDLGACVGKVTRHVVDVTDREQMKALSETVISDHGGINLLIKQCGHHLTEKLFHTQP